LVTAADGADVPLVTTEGNYKYVGRLDLRFDVAGNLISIDEATSFPRRVVVKDAASDAAGVADSVVPNPAVQASSVAPVTECLAAFAQPIARTEVALNVNDVAVPSLGFTRGVRTGETNGGNLVADAFLHSYDVYAGAAGLPARGGATKVVAVQNSGGIRQAAGPVLPVGTTLDATSGAYVGVPGTISRRNTLDVLSFFTNAMTVVTDVTATELKSILEWSGSSLPGRNGKLLQIGGMTVTYNLSNQPQTISGTGAAAVITNPGARVVSVVLDDGTKIVESGAPVAGAPDVSIVTNSFTADGGDDFVTFRGIPRDRKVNLVAVYEQALVEYLLSFPPSNGLPTIPSTDARYANPNGSGRITVVP
jgi:5'-nucleotidase